jgi:hypothetical protein
MCRHTDDWGGEGWTDTSHMTLLHHTVVLEVERVLRTRQAGERGTLTDPLFDSE